MITLINKFIDICRFRAGPQDLPHSRFLLVLIIILYSIVGYIVTPIEATIPKVISSVIDTAMIIGFCYAGLWIRSMTNRGVQTITALTGTGVIFGLVSIGLFVLFPDLRNEEPTVFSSILILALVMWNIAVFGHVLKSALDIPFWAGIGIAVLYVYTSLRVTSVIYVAHA